MKSKKGFTLIEIIVTIALLALIGTILCVNMVGLNKKQDAKEKNRQINVVKGAAEAYLEVTRQNGCVSLSDLVADGYLSEKEAKNFKDQSVYIEKNENGEIIFDTYKTAESCVKSYESYTISFNANGGIGSIPNLIVTPDSSTKDPVIDLSAYKNKVKKEGYVLVGWTDSTSDNAKVYTNKYSVKASKTLYAKWEKEKYTITYQSDGDVRNLPAKQIGNFGTSVSVSSVVPIRKGYRFLGWSDIPNGNIKYYSGSRINISSKDITLYAVWKKVEFTLTFDSGKGTVSPKTKIVTYEDPYGDLPIPQRNGYSFIGWYDKASSGKQITKDTVVLEDKDHTIYSYWKDATPPICGDVSDPATKWTNQDRTITLKCKDNESGCKKDEYVYSSKGTDVVRNVFINIEDKEGNKTSCPVDVKVDKTTPYTPIVDEIDFEDSRNISKADINCDTYEREYSGDRHCAIVVTTRSSSRWEVWFYFDSAYHSFSSPEEWEYSYNNSTWSNNWEKTKRSNAWYLRTTNEAGSSSGTLYLHITKASYTVSFDANGGSVDTASKIVANHDPYGELPVPYKEGYKFIGWFTEKDGGTQVDSATEVTTNRSHTLYAHWAIGTYVATFNGNGGTPATQTKSYIYNQPLAPLPIATRDGYSFKGWSINLNENKILREDQNYPWTDDVTLYAYWHDDIPPTVSAATSDDIEWYDNNGIWSPKNDTWTNKDREITFYCDDKGVGCKNGQYVYNTADDSSDVIEGKLGLFEDVNGNRLIFMFKPLVDKIKPNTPIVAKVGKGEGTDGDNFKSADIVCDSPDNLELTTKRTCNITIYRKDSSKRVESSWSYGYSNNSGGAPIRVKVSLDGNNWCNWGEGCLGADYAKAYVRLEDAAGNIGEVLTVNFTHK